MRAGRVRDALGRVWAVALLSAAVLALVVSATGSATPTLPLNGEQFYSPGFRTEGLVDGLTSGCVLNPDGSNSANFNVHSTATPGPFLAHGPYPGGWVVTGQLTVGSDVYQGGTRRVVSLSGTFTVNSAGTQVTGTYTLDPTVPTDLPGSPTWAAGFGCGPLGTTGGILQASVVWEATITDGSGSLHDQGTAPISAQIRDQAPALNFILTSVPVSSDADGDGIDDAVDVPGPDAAFSDAVPPALGSGTSGVVTSVDPGASVVVEDAEDASVGVKITVLGSGVAQLSICGSYFLTVHAQATFYMTCHSVGLDVVKGEVTVNLADDTSVTVPAGSSATVAQGTGGRYSITDVSGPVTLTIEGQTKVITAATTIAAWTFVGFAQPVDNSGVLNSLQAGQAVPLKWRILDANGAAVTDLTTASLSTTSIPCQATAPTDAIEQFEAAESELKNLGNGYYQINWKASKTYAGSCRRLDLDLSEGITRQALFKFKS